MNLVPRYGWICHVLSFHLTPWSSKSDAYVRRSSFEDSSECCTSSYQFEERHGLSRQRSTARMANIQNLWATNKGGWVKEGQEYHTTVQFFTWYFFASFQAFSHSNRWIDKFEFCLHKAGRVRAHDLVKVGPLLEAAVRVLKRDESSASYIAYCTINGCF